LKNIIEPKMTNRVGSEKKPGSSDGLKVVEKDQ
jgi:hypothetical protein